jgi:hypothetical protein
MYILEGSGQKLTGQAGYNSRTFPSRQSASKKFVWAYFAVSAMLTLLTTIYNFIQL